MNIDLCCCEKFDDIIKKPIFKDFKKLLKIEDVEIDPKINDMVRHIRENRDEIINYFFVTWLASANTDAEVKDRLIQTFFENSTIVMDYVFEDGSYKTKINFESKYLAEE